MKVRSSRPGNPGVSTTNSEVSTTNCEVASSVPSRFHLLDDPAQVPLPDLDLIHQILGRVGEVGQQLVRHLAKFVQS